MRYLSSPHRRPANPTRNRTPHPDQAGTLIWAIHQKGHLSPRQPILELRSQLGFRRRIHYMPWRPTYEEESNVTTINICVNSLCDGRGTVREL